MDVKKSSRCRITAGFLLLALWSLSIAGPAHAGSTGLPSGVSIAPSSSDSRYSTVSDVHGFTFNVPSDWYFDSTQEPPAWYHMTSGDGLLGMTVSVLKIGDTSGPSGSAATFLNAQINHDKEAYLNVRIKEDPDNISSLGWVSNSQAEVRYTNDDGQDEDHVYTAGIHGGLTVELDWSWVRSIPGSELLPGSLTYVGASPATTSNVAGAPVPITNPSAPGITLLQANGTGNGQTAIFQSNSRKIRICVTISGNSADNLEGPEATIDVDYANNGSIPVFYAVNAFTPGQTCAVANTNGGGLFLNVQAPSYTSWTITVTSA